MTIGKPLPRVEGVEKVTGRARFSGDVVVTNMLHGVLVGAPVAAGRVTAVHKDAALAHPGVVRVLTRADMPQFGKIAPPAAVLHLPLQTDEIRHEGEPVAIVLGETIEAAEGGAALIKVDVQRGEALVPGRGQRVAPVNELPIGSDVTKGDLQAGLAAAVQRVEQAYEQPARHHNPMEPSATLAQWDGDQLTLYDSVQAGFNVPPVVSAALGIAPENVRIVSPHTGGGFGCKGFVWPHQVLAPAAARVVGRPVRIALSRSLMYANVGYQPWIQQQVQLGAKADGALTAIRHEIVNSSAMLDTYFEAASETSKGLYACPAIHTKQMIERVTINLPTAMRAPVEGPGTWAIECAMDELAVALKMDPLDLRLKNYAERDPHTDKPWSSKKLREAYEDAARRYGWRERHARPKQDGPWKIGHGMATATMGNFRHAAAARVRLKDNGSAVIETGTHDIGTGTLTVFTQIAADTLQIPEEKVSIVWGDTRLPRASPVYGSSATMTTGSAIMQAALNAQEKLAKLVPNVADHGKAMRAAGIADIVGEAQFTLPNNLPFNADGQGTPHAMRTWGAVFVEIGVDPDFGILRLRRVVGSYSAGRIINPKTARSQLTGGIIWEWGKATMEESVQEPQHGRWLAKNLSNVAIPVNADIPTNLDVSFVEEFDPHASTLGARGIGELGATGIAAAVGNAVYDAVGVRVRSLPILPWKILEALNA
ncbi:MAG: xanthine dehydrogenase family protein molybdopterin-binding subunit [Steroidobacteraceae bacterium]